VKRSIDYGAKVLEGMSDYDLDPETQTLVREAAESAVRLYDADIERLFGAGEKAREEREATLRARLEAVESELRQTREELEAERRTSDALMERTESNERRLAALQSQHEKQASALSHSESQRAMALHDLGRAQDVGDALLAALATLLHGEDR